MIASDDLLSVAFIVYEPRAVTTWGMIKRIGMPVATEVPSRLPRYAVGPGNDSGAFTTS